MVLPANAESAKELALEIGLPVMVKASYGGGGRGMRVLKETGAIVDSIEGARREAVAVFGNDEIYLEKYGTRARHGSSLRTWLRVRTSHLVPLSLALRTHRSSPIFLGVGKDEPALA